MLVSIQSVCTS